MIKKLAVSESEPLALFVYAIKSEQTKEKYKRRLYLFFEFLGIEGNLEEKSKLFTAKAREDLNWLYQRLGRR